MSNESGEAKVIDPPEARNTDTDAWARGWEEVVAWVIGLAAALLAFVGSRGNMAGGPDAVTYLSSAESLRAGHGLGNWLEHPMVTFPPAWPVAIAAVMLFGLSSSAAATVLMSAALLTTPRLVLSLMRHATDQRAARVIAMVAVGLSPVLLPWGYLALSEVPFSTIVLGSAVLALNSRNKSITGRLSPRTAMAGAIALAALAPLIRYAGVAIPIALALWVALDRDRPRRWINGTVALVLGLLPFGLVALRNTILVGSSMGRRPPSSLNLIQVILEGTAALGRTAVWTFDSTPAVVSFALGVILIAVGAWISLQPGASEPSSGRAARLLFGLLASLQWLVMLAVRWRSEIDSLDGRLLSMTAVLIVMLMACAVGDMMDHSTSLIRNAVAAAAAAWCVIGILAVGRVILGPGNVNGFTGERWAAVRQLPELDQIPRECRRMDISDIEDPDAPIPSCGVLANDVWGWYGSSLSPLMTPRRGIPDDLERLKKAVDDGSRLYVAWTTVTDPYGYLIPIATLREQLDLKVVGSDDDITLYRTAAD